MQRLPFFSIDYGRQSPLRYKQEDSCVSDILIRTPYDLSSNRKYMGYRNRTCITVQHQGLLTAPPLRCMIRMLEITEGLNLNVFKHGIQMLVGRSEIISNRVQIASRSH